MLALDICSELYMLLDVVLNMERRGFLAVSGGEVSCWIGDGVRWMMAAGASAGF